MVLGTELNINDFRACVFCKDSSLERIEAVRPETASLYCFAGSRDTMQEMVRRCKDGEFNLIIVECMAGFSDTLAHSISLCRDLKANTPPIGVYFIKEGMYTLSQEADLYLSTLERLLKAEGETKSNSRGYAIFKNRRVSCKQH